MLKRIFFSIMMLLLIHPFILPAGADTQELFQDAGLVVQLKGKAVYSNKKESSKTAAVEPFMKIRTGDRIELKDGSRIDLLFFSSRSKETWTGPAVVQILTDRAQPVGKASTAEPQIAAVDQLVVVNIANSDLPLPRTQTGRAGMMVLRSVAPFEYNPIKQEYQTMKEKADPGDPLPDLYYLSILSMYNKYAEIEKVVDEMLVRDPDNQVLKHWKEWAANNKPKEETEGTNQP